MMEDETMEGVYEEDSAYCYSESAVLTENEATFMKVNEYDWLLKYTVSRKAESAMVYVFADFTSRYCLVDKTTLDVTVESSDMKITVKFDLLKEKDQRFSIDLTKNGFSDASKEYIKVTGSIAVKDIKYCEEATGTIGSLTKSSRPHDVVLVVEGKKFFVHKLYLATWSRYFNTLFYGNFAEKDGKKVTIEDVNSGEFHILLQLIHPDMTIEISNSNVLYLLKLADRFDMPSVMAMCGKHLQDFGNSPTLTLIDRLELSDKYNLSQLQLTCLTTIHKKSSLDFRAFLEQNRDKIRKLSNNVVRNLI